VRRILFSAAAAIAIAVGYPAIAAAATTWSLQAVPLPAGSTHGSLARVSCPSAANCFAAGYYFRSGTQLALVEHWNGSTWSVQTTPSPAGATAAALAGVSCVSAASCTAVGSYFAKAKPQRTLAEHWNGSKWSLQATPNPADASASELAAVSCTSAASCTATGDDEDGDARVTLAEHWNGTNWAIQATPNPAGAEMTFLYGVSCGSAASCNAVGSTDTGPLAEHWNGSAWSIQATPVPAGVTVGMLSDVSCWSPTKCIAAGDFVNGSGNGRLLAEYWNGSTWARQTVPLPPGAISGVLTGISCTGVTDCTAVGQDTKASPSPQALAERWNGSTWTPQQTAQPSVNKVLQSVSCIPAPVCTAVGAIPSGSKAKPLAERN
jgi:hypothetical protein